MGLLCLSNLAAETACHKQKAPDQAGALGVAVSLEYQSSPPNAVNRFSKLMKILYRETYKVTVASM